MKTVRISLFVLIVIGIILLITQNVWVPKFVNWILKIENTSATVNPATSDVTATWKTYTNTTMGFEFNYPKEYTIQSNAGNPDNYIVFRDTSVRPAPNSDDPGKAFTVAFADTSNLKDWLCSQYSTGCVHVFKETNFKTFDSSKLVGYITNTGTYDSIGFGITKNNTSVVLETSYNYAVFPQELFDTIITDTELPEIVSTFRFTK